MEPVSEADLRRLRWQCRRGLLENDLVLEKFLARRAGMLDRERLSALSELLQLSDNELWELVSGRVEPGQERHREIVDWLREA